MAEINFEVTVPESLHAKRLDQTLAKLAPDYSREQLKAWILQGNVSINSEIITKPRTKVIENQLITVCAQLDTQTFSEAQNISLNIVFEDEHFMVINKPAGLVVHPGAGNPHNTLLNGLLHHNSSLDKLPRAGIVHRLDKGTTGLMLVAKTLEAYSHLVTQMKKRLVKRQYIALVIGSPISGGTVEAPIDRHPKTRIKMAVSPKGKPAVTHYRIKTRFKSHTLLNIELETGRTHQIRVHLSHIGYPLVGDPTYGGKRALSATPSPSCQSSLKAFKRQALHACQLNLSHPIIKTPLEFKAPLPDDFQSLLKHIDPYE